jgi:hypothetical protein
MPEGSSVLRGIRGCCQSEAGEERREKREERREKREERREKREERRENDAPSCLRVFV